MKEYFRRSEKCLLLLGLFFSAVALPSICVDLLERATPLRLLSEIDLPDPHFQLRPNQEIWITGTSFKYLVYKSGQDYEAGKKPEVRKFRLFRRVGGRKIPLLEKYGEVPWGVIAHTWKDAGGENVDVLFAGVMVPGPGKEHAKWPENNEDRRIVAFVKDAEGDWSSLGPCFGEERGWEGHAYDPDLFTDRNGASWLYYAKVDRISTVPRRHPIQTQNYGRRVWLSKDVTKPLAFGGEFLAQGVRLRSDPHGPPFLSTMRAEREPLPRVVLVEGPRVREIEIPLSHIKAPVEKNADGTQQIKLKLNGTSHALKVADGEVRPLLMGFSASDFQGSHYGVDFAVGLSPTEFVPLLTKDRKDLKDFKEILGLDRGLASAGRPNPFKIGRKMRLLFHGATSLPKDLDDLANLQRRAYDVPFEVSIDKDGELRFATGDGD